jgi:hypothetical protein
MKEVHMPARQYRPIGLILLAVTLAAPAMAQAPPATTYAARPGETINLGAFYLVNPTTCQNLAVARPDIEVLSGPPDLKFEVREAMVIPQNYGCKNEVKGGYIWLTVPADIAASSAHIIARITHHDRNGPRPLGYAFNLMIAH